MSFLSERAEQRGTMIDVEVGPLERARVDGDPTGSAFLGHPSVFCGDDHGPPNCAAAAFVAM